MSAVQTGPKSFPADEEDDDNDQRFAMYGG